MIRNIFALKPVLILAVSLSVQAQTANIKKVKNNNVKTVSDWRNAFPVLPNYRRVFEEAQFEDGKIYYQTAQYRNPKNKQDFFEIRLNRHTDINPLSIPAPSDWVKHLKIGNYRAYQLFPTCGLSFFKYTLDVYPDNLTSISLVAKDLSTTDVIELAKTIDFRQISETMKRQRNIH